jgi:CHAD domain-containing protein
MTTPRAENATTGEVVRKAVGAAVSRLADHVGEASRRDDAEEVHQSRVAARRLRSDLRTFAPLLSDTWTADLRDELSWLGGVLGAVRDGDVLRARLEAELPALPPEDRPAGRALVALLESERQHARAAMSEALADHRYTHLGDALRNAADEPKFDRDPHQKARPVLAKLVQRAWSKLERAVADLDEAASDEQLHAIRIRAKRVRYAADAAVPAWGSRARKLAKAAASVQDALGRFNDAVVTEAWLRGAAAKTPDAAFAAGLLAERQRQAADACREAFPGVWKKASKRKLRTWLR